MQGWLIFTHSVRQVFGNIGPALKISGVLMAVQFVVTEWFQSRFPAFSTESPAPPVPGFGMNAMIFLAVMVLTGPWVAIAWHRYVLLEEEPTSIIPPLDGSKWAAYVWAMLRIGVVLMLVAVGLSAVFGLVLVTVGSPQSAMGLLVVLVFIGVVYLGNRLSLLMPAAALGEKMTLMQSIALTRPGAKSILWLSLFYVGAGMLAQAAAGGLAMLALPLGFVAQIVLSWLLFLVGASMMTTLYGHFAQGRPLVTE